MGDNTDGKGDIAFLLVPLALLLAIYLSSPRAAWIFKAGYRWAKANYEYYSKDDN